VTQFGHDALLVERAGLPALVYNFGMYTEAAIAPHHVLGGTLRYYLDVSRLGRTLAYYAANDREIVRQVLDLDPASAETLARALSQNSLPENAAYAYDFARDNCATRVRDAVDRALGGALRRALAGPARLTYREHALRLTADDWYLFFLFDLALGRSADRQLSAWEDAFLPDRLRAHLRDVRVPGPNGARPLVKRESLLLRARRAPLREAPPVRAPWYAALGFGTGALFACAGRRRSRAFRVFLGLGSAALGLFAGLLGLWLLLLLGTQVHATTHQNANALLFPALALLLVLPGFGVARGRALASQKLVRYAGLCALVAALGLLLATAVGQESLPVALLAVPLFSGAWLGARATLRTA
jgi:hypothetical protein